MMLLQALSLVAVSVHGHYSMIMPVSRNSIDAELPAWNGGKFPDTGSIEPYTCKCTNGTSKCNAGQSCFWFSQGCTIGCKSCDGNGTRLPNFDHCPGESIAPTLNDPRWRTANQNATAGSEQDIYKYNPWRAPGRAPVADACGMAGGNTFEVFNAGAYNATRYAKQGDLGTKVLAKRPSGTVWRRGDAVKTRWQQTAWHGGGYIYRLCPSNEALTEECFQKNPLEFAMPAKHVLRFADPKLDYEINATIVTEGGGKGWMKNPLFGGTDVNCDYIVQPPAHCPWECPGCGAPKYAADGACPTRCSDQFPGLPSYAGTDPTWQKDPVRDGVKYTKFAIEDTIIVPKDIAAGEYVLGWRIDCETTSQVWTTCSDITII